MQWSDLHLWCPFERYCIVETERTCTDFLHGALRETFRAASGATANGARKAGNYEPESEEARTALRGFNFKFHGERYLE